MRRIFSFLSALVFLCGVGATQARADTLFTFTGFGDTATASLQTSPIPSSFVLGTSFTLPNISALVDGDIYSGAVTFYTASAGGGASGQGAMFGGPQLFTGLTSAPTFLPGSYTLSGTADLGDGPEAITGSLTISQPSAVPEPSSMILLGTGALGLVGVVRRKVLAA